MFSMFTVRAGFWSVKVIEVDDFGHGFIKLNIHVHSNDLVAQMATLKACHFFLADLTGDVTSAF